jgi:hypothetical protein
MYSARFLTSFRDEAGWPWGINEVLNAQIATETTETLRMVQSRHEGSIEDPNSSAAGRIC